MPTVVLAVVSVSLRNIVATQEELLPVARSITKGMAATEVSRTPEAARTENRIVVVAS